MNNNFLVTNETSCHWFSRTTQLRVKIIGWSLREWPKIVIHHTVFYFFHIILCSVNNRRSLISSANKKTAFSNPVLWCHPRTTQVDLWRHPNAGHWYCDVIFVDCSCVRKLTQSWYSLVDIIRAYQSPTTRNSPCRVWQLDGKFL